MMIAQVRSVEPSAPVSGEFRLEQPQPQPQRQPQALSPASNGTGIAPSSLTGIAPFSVPVPKIIAQSTDIATTTTTDKTTDTTTDTTTATGLDARFSVEYRRERRINEPEGTSTTTSALSLGGSVDVEMTTQGEQNIQDTQNTNTQSTRNVQNVRSGDSSSSSSSDSDSGSSSSSSTSTSTVGAEFSVVLTSETIENLPRGKAIATWKDGIASIVIRNPETGELEFYDASIPEGVPYPEGSITFDGPPEEIDGDVISDGETAFVSQDREGGKVAVEYRRRRRTTSTP